MYDNPPKVLISYVIERTTNPTLYTGEYTLVISIGYIVFYIYKLCGPCARFVIAKGLLL